MSSQGKTQHVGLLGTQAPVWSGMAWVMGTHEDVAQTRIKRDCAGCGEDVFTSIRYPDDVAVICEMCAYEELIEKEVA